MLKCRQVTEQASEWLEGDLNRVQRARIRVHLALCRHCRQFISGLRATSELVQAKQLEEESPSHELVQRIDAALQEKLSGVTDNTPFTPVSPDTEAGNDPLIDSVTEPHDPKVRRIFAEIEEREGMVPNLYRAYAHNPEVLEHNWNRVKSLMYAGNLEPVLKQSIATLVSHDNACRYCVVYHRGLLIELGISETAIQAMMGHEDYGVLSHKNQALLKLAREANRNPHGTPPELVQQARDAGASELELVEALGIMELYVSFNRFLDSLRVPLETQQS